jgi:hypothetical protein
MRAIMMKQLERESKRVLAKTRLVTTDASEGYDLEKKSVQSLEYNRIT